MTEKDETYRYQVEKVIRGREAKKIAEMEQQGWTVDEQVVGRLRTEITFRRVVTPTRFKPWMAIAALLGIGVILLGGAAIAEVIGGSDDPREATSERSPSPTSESTEPSASPTASSPSQSPSEVTSETPSATATESPSATPTAEPSPSVSQTPSTVPAGDEVLTVKNSPDLKRLLAQGESPSVCKKFAEMYEGRTIEFDGSVAVVGGGTYLVYAGDDSDTEYVPGPSFQFRTLTVNGGRPAAGDNLRFVAIVGPYKAAQGLFLLSQVTTSAR